MRVTESAIKKLIHQSNLIEGYDDEKMDAQGLVAWRHLVQLADLRDLTMGDVCKVQKIITLTQDDLQPDWRGYYRSTSGQRVWIAGREGLAPQHIEMAMDEWLHNRLTQSPIASHVDFEHIHPFVDGNGRTGRLLMWWHQMRRDEPLTKLTAADRQSYYAWFK